MVRDMRVGKRGAKSQAREPTDRRIVKEKNRRWEIETSRGDAGRSVCWKRRKGKVTEWFVHATENQGMGTL